MGRIVSNPPSALEVKAARIASGLTQSKAAALVHCSARTWQNWELSCSLMHPAFWELFKSKTANSENAQTQDSLDASRYRYLRDGNAFEPEELSVKGGVDLDSLVDHGIQYGSNLERAKIKEKFPWQK